MYKAIVFDFFGVFCAPIATNWFKKTVLDYGAKKAEFQALCTESDLGKLSRAEFNQKAAELAGVSVAEVERGIEAEVVIDTELVEYVRKLKAEGYRIACLSNGGHEWTLKVINDHGLRDLFEEVVLSADLGIVKPDPDTYLRTWEKLKLPAADTIFVDDREANVVAAEACGMHGLVFTDTARFIKDIQELSDEEAK
ncbi:MAG TPA: HAD family phosphatase [Candidatus Saccharimonadales bacterium]|nr:HAD family phosphatase [Candidatus Saccharimonadales bacterium]